MTFLGEVGGIQQSFFIIGAVLNFFFSGKDQALQLLEHHFFINSSPYERKTRPGKWLNNCELGDASTINRLILGSSLKWLPCNILCCESQRGKLKRYKAFTERVDDFVEKATDIRTIVRSHSLVLALIRVVFERVNHPLLKLQRGGKIMALDSYEVETEALLYGSDSKNIFNKRRQVSTRNDEKYFAQALKLMQSDISTMSKTEQQLLRGILPRHC